MNDVEKFAHVFTEADLKEVKPRKTDIPWPKDFVDEHQMPVLDIQRKPLLEQWEMTRALALREALRDEGKEGKER